MRPELEQPPLALAPPGDGIEVAPVIVAEPREQREIVRPGKDVHRVDLQQAEPIDRALYMTSICRPLRSFGTEALGGERNSAGGSR